MPAPQSSHCPPSRPTFRSPPSRAATPSRACTRLGRRRRPRTAGCCTRPATRQFADVHAQRAEAVAGAAVRRGAAASSASATRSRRSRCCARAIPASRGTSRPSRDMLATAGNTADDLQCGTHAPALLRGARRGAAAAAVFAARAQLLGQAQRHARATACQCGSPKHDYLAFDHPLQQAIRRAVAHFTATPEAALVAGHRRLLGAELRGAARAARARVRAARGGRRSTPTTARAPQALADAMTAHPEMVSGEGRSDLALMPRRARRLGAPRSAPKACRRSASAAAGWGIAIKVADGNARGLHPGDGRGPRPAGAARRRRRGSARAVGATAGHATTAGIATGRGAQPWLSWTKSTGR